MNMLNAKLLTEFKPVNLNYTRNYSSLGSRRIIMNSGAVRPAILSILAARGGMGEKTA
jgi:hypothetical protein